MDSGSWDTLFINHFHTEKSTEYVNNIIEEPEWKGANHLGDPLKILEKLDRGQKAVITLTEHYRTNGKEFFRKLGEEAEELGGSHELNEYSLILELEGAKVMIINGVEASYKRRDTHLIIAGLPIEDRDEYYNLNDLELEEVLEKAAYAHPAHPFYGKYRMDKQEMDNVCKMIQESPAELFIPYTYAYNIKIDRKARGETGSKQDVQDLAEKHDAPLIVEHDHHIHLPSNLSGIGLLSNKAIKELEVDRVPIEQIKKARIVEPTKLDTFKDLFRAGRTYADQLPNYMEWKNFWKRLSFPYETEELESWRDRYYSVELKELDIDELEERSRALNQ